MPDVPKVSSCYFDDEVEIDCCHMAMSEWSNYIYGSKLGLNRIGKQVQPAIPRDYSILPLRMMLLIVV